ncbi:Coatomer subunit alpha-3, partial [Dissostichus eleginoides]
MCSLSLYNPSVTLLNNTDGDKVVVIASRSLLGKTLSRSHGDHNRKDAVTQEGWVLSKLRFGPLTLTEQHEGHRVTLFLAAPPPTLKHSTHSYRLTGCSHRESVNRKDRVQRHSTLPMPSSAESRTQQAVWRVRGWHPAHLSDAVALTATSLMNDLQEALCAIDTICSS